MRINDWIAIAGIVVPTILGFIAWLVTIANRVSKLETKMEVFWKAVSIDAAKILHSPHPERERLDQLIDAYVNGNIRTNELTEMRGQLLTIVDNGSTPCAERLLASMLMRVIEARFGTHMEEAI